MTSPPEHGLRLGPYSLTMFWVYPAPGQFLVTLDPPPQDLRLIPLDMKPFRSATLNSFEGLLCFTPVQTFVPLTSLCSLLFFSHGTYLRLKGIRPHSEQECPLWHFHGLGAFHAPPPPLHHHLLMSLTRKSHFTSWSKHHQLIWNKNVSSYKMAWGSWRLATLHRSVMRRCILGAACLDAPFARMAVMDPSGAGFSCMLTTGM